MPRTKTIPKSFDSPYFNDVTPLWVAPKNAPIDPKFHSGIKSLAEWIGPDWPDKEKTEFFLIRTILVGSCELWEAYPWQRDVSIVSGRRLNNRQRQRMASAAARFHRSLKAAPFRSEKVNWIRSILGSLGAEADSSLTNGQAIERLERSIEEFAKQIKGLARVGVTFGPLEYPSVPKALPRREVAVALFLADQVSIWRKDGSNYGTIDYPHKPTITKNLPWKAIAQFASPPGSDPEDFLNPDNVQRLVTNISRRVTRITSPPANRTIETANAEF